MIRTLIGLLWDGPPDPVIDTLIAKPRVLYAEPDWSLIQRMGAQRWRAVVEAQGQLRQRGSLLHLAQAPRS